MASVDPTGGGPSWGGLFWRGLFWPGRSWRPPSWRSRRTLGAVLFGTLASFSLPRTAEGQLEGTLDRFRASATPEDDFHLSRPDPLRHLQFGAQLHLDYGKDPLRLAADGSLSLGVVDSQLTATAGFSLGLFDRVMVAAGLPVSIVLEGEDQTALSPFGVAAAEGAGLGDAYLAARIRLFGDQHEPVSLALQATVTFPTSELFGDGVYRGDPTLSAQPELLAEFRPGADSRILVNLGARVRDPSNGPGNSKLGQELTYGLGFALPVWKPEAGTHLDVHLQGFGTSTFGSFEDASGHAIEAALGAKFFHQSGLVVGAAGGPGLTRGIGTPQFRIIGMVGWATPHEQSAPTPPGETPAAVEAAPAAAPVEAPLAQVETTTPEPTEPEPDMAVLDPDEIEPAPLATTPEQMATNLLEQGSTAMAERAFFRINGTIMLRRSFRPLRRIAQLLAEHPEIQRFRVEGHTDTRGSREFNLRLSQARADAVVNFLVKEGVSEARLQAVGLGPDRPAVENARMPWEHARNRRVEFRVVEP